MRFESIAGNLPLKTRLESVFASGRLPHCIVVEGPEGSGRRTLARLIARAALCRAGDPASVPCGACASCVKAEKGIHPDIFEMTGSGASDGFPVAALRDIRRDVFIVPSESARRAVLFLGADTMSDRSQNALLTVLEEPPSYALFIITCRSAAALLPTVRSRAAVFSLSPVDDEAAAAYLRGRGVPEGDIGGLIRGGGGIIGRMLEESGGTGKTNAFCAAVAQKLLLPDELPLLAECAVLEKDRELCRSAVPGLRSVFRDALVLKNGGADLSFPDEAPARALSSKLSSSALIAMLEAVDRAEEMLRRNIGGALFSTALPCMLREAAAGSGGAGPMPE